MDQNIQTLLEENECLLADGFQDAIIGISQGDPPKAVYNSHKCIEIMMERDGMDMLEAEEFFDYNVLGCYMGEKTPIFVMISENE